MAFGGVANPVVELMIGIPVALANVHATYPNAVSDLASDYVEALEAANLPIDFTQADLDNSVKRLEAAGLIEQTKGIVTSLFGIPAPPKMEGDLTPFGGLQHLRDYQQNPHTQQFVTWGEVDPIQLNGFPDLTNLGVDYGNVGDVSDYNKVPGDTQVANLSARVLTTDAPGGYMTPLASYPSLDHGGVINDFETCGEDWMQALLTPMTTLRLSGAITAANADQRFYVVQGDTFINFITQSETYVDSLNRSHTPTANNFEYRVVAFDAGMPNYGAWQEIGTAGSLQFSDLESVSPLSLANERIFRLDWRSVNPLGGREHIRTAFFQIDDTQPSITSMDVFPLDQNDAGEVCDQSKGLAKTLAFRTSLISANPRNNPNLTALIGAPEADYVITNPTGKFVRVDFTESGEVDYQWNDPALTSPTTVDLPSNIFSLHLGDHIGPGPHTLYYRIEDADGRRGVVAEVVKTLRFVRSRFWSTRSRPRRCSVTTPITASISSSGAIPPCISRRRTSSWSRPKDHSPCPGFPRGPCRSTLRSPWAIRRSSPTVNSASRGHSSR